MPRTISKRNLESVKQQVHEYDVTLTKIIPRDIECENDVVGEEIFFLLYNRETLEKDFQKFGIEGELAFLWQQVQELDALLLAQREVIVNAFHRDYYKRERERLKMPRAYWWWYLDELESVELPGGAMAGSKLEMGVEVL
ncbi:hypothetical protein HYR99_13540 [Candidatus Poribacteria bacterium]|nr:hypothetical protein [Candidatus Poribacteria bacterium]